MNQHVHYDLAAYEKQMREQFAADAKEPVDEFHRLQMFGNETIIQFGIFLARLDNEGIDDNAAAQAACAIIASQIDNLAYGIDGDRGEVLYKLLQVVARFAFKGGEILSMSEAPVVPGGRA